MPGPKNFASQQAGLCNKGKELQWDLKKRTRRNKAKPGGPYVKHATIKP